MTRHSQSAARCHASAELWLLHQCPQESGRVMDSQELRVASAEELPNHIVLADVFQEALGGGARPIDFVGWMCAFDHRLGRSVSRTTLRQACFCSITTFFRNVLALMLVLRALSRTTVAWPCNRSSCACWGEGPRRIAFGHLGSDMRALRSPPGRGMLHRIPQVKKLVGDSAVPARIRRALPSGLAVVARAGGVVGGGS